MHGNEYIVQTSDLDMTEQISIYFFILLPLVAFLYASVGHGGASGYLALMALFGFLPEHMKPTALLLNILVSLIAFIHFYKKENFSWNLFLWLISTSIPLAFLGGGVNLHTSTYKLVLGILLIIPALRLLYKNSNSDTPHRSYKLVPVLLIGASIGYVSGLIGIGGGILLSPILILLGWAGIKETAALSALFITVNSISGLLAQKNLNLVLNQSLYLIILLALCGGLAGAYFGSKKFNTITLRVILSLVLLVASYKLIITA